MWGHMELDLTSGHPVTFYPEFAAYLKKFQSSGVHLGNPGRTGPSGKFHLAAVRLGSPKIVGDELTLDCTAATTVPEQYISLEA